MVDVIIQKSGEQIVGHPNSMKVAGEMQVDILHRDDLRVAPSRCSAFHTKDRA